MDLAVKMFLVSGGTLACLAVSLMFAIGGARAWWERDWAEGIVWYLFSGAVAMATIAMVLACVT